MRTPRIGGWALVAASLVTPLAGCRIFDESLLSSDAGADAGPAPADAGPDAADAGPDGACMLRRPPARPDVADGPDTAELVIALRNLTIDQRDDRWRTIGFDLDGLCSDPPEPVVECLPPSPSAPPATDGEGGIDNVVGQSLLEILLIAFPDIAEDINRTTTNGNGVVLLRVRGWNGEPDDPRVEVMLAQSRFGTPALPDGGIPDASAARIQPDGGGLPPPPTWDGNDVYWLSPDSLVDRDLERPRVLVGASYVREGTLVLPIPDGIDVFFNGRERGFVFRLIDAVATLRLPTDGLNVPEAVVAGRWPIAELLEALPLYGYCAGTEDYARFERLTELAADVRAVPGSGGPGAICDAISMGVGFDGVVARIGGVASFRDDPRPCADAGM